MYCYTFWVKQECFWKMLDKLYLGVFVHYYITYPEMDITNTKRIMGIKIHKLIVIQ